MNIQKTLAAAVAVSMISTGAFAADNDNATLAVSQSVPEFREITLDNTGAATIEVDATTGLFAGNAALKIGTHTIKSNVDGSFSVAVSGVQATHNGAAIATSADLVRTGATNTGATTGFTNVLTVNSLALFNDGSLITTVDDTDIEAGAANLLNNVSSGPSDLAGDVQLNIETSGTDIPVAGTYTNTYTITIADPAV